MSHADDEAQRWRSIARTFAEELAEPLAKAFDEQLARRSRLEQKAAAEKAAAQASRDVQALQRRVQQQKDEQKLTLLLGWAGLVVTVVAGVYASQIETEGELIATGISLLSLDATVANFPFTFLQAVADAKDALAVAADAAQAEAEALALDEQSESERLNVASAGISKLRFCSVGTTLCSGIDHSSMKKQEAVALVTLKCHALACVLPYQRPQHSADAQVQLPTTFKWPETRSPAGRCPVASVQLASDAQQGLGQLPVSTMAGCPYSVWRAQLSIRALGTTEGVALCYVSFV